MVVEIMGWQNPKFGALVALWAGGTGLLCGLAPSLLSASPTWLSPLVTLPLPTALTLIGLGGALGLLNYRDQVALTQTWQRLVLGGLTLGLVGSVTVSLGFSADGATGVTLLLVSGALLGLAWWPQWVMVAQQLALGAVLLMLAHLWDTGWSRLLPLTPTLPTLPPLTILGALVLAGGTLALRSRQGLLGILRSSQWGGVMVRRWLPWAIAFPFLVNLGRLLAQQWGVYDPALVALLEKMLVALVLVGVLGTNARSLNQAAHKLDRAGIALQDLSASLQQQVETKIIELQQSNERLRQAVANQTELADVLRINENRLRLVTTIAQRIRRSLQPEAVLQTAVTEVREFLQADRVVIYQFQPGWSGIIRDESVNPEFASLLHQVIYDPCFPGKWVPKYANGLVTQIEDLYAQPLTPCYVELLESMQVRANLVVPILLDVTPQDPLTSPCAPPDTAAFQRHACLWGLLVVHQCSGPRHWHDWEAEVLRELATQIGLAIQQSDLYAQAQKQAQREAWLNELLEAMRSSLELDQILEQTSQRLVSIFAASRSVVTLCSNQEMRCQPSYVYDQLQPNPSQHRCTPFHHNPCAQIALSQTETIAIDDVTTHAQMPPAATAFTAESQVRALLVVTIRMDDQVKGVLCVQQCDRPRQWTTDEKMLLKQVADQLAVAIHQAELYQTVQTLNVNLEQQVAERTADLTQTLEFEALLKRITEKVRDSLDESQILQTAIEELAQVLDAVNCDNGLYDLDAQTSTIQHEATESPILPTAHRVIQMAEFAAIYGQLKDGHALQFCWAYPYSNAVRPTKNTFVALACPLMDDHGVLGDIWVYRHPDQPFDLAEMQLVQQVANQCAIAVRQSRLYQAAQQQVEELARLNQLKDDFLSTVSHELRTPMSGIQLAISMLERLLFPDGLNASTPKLLSGTCTEISRSGHCQVPKVQQYFQILQQETKREIALINDLLDLSRLESGTQPLSLVTIDLRHWIYHLTEVFEMRTQKQQQHFQVDVATDLPPITTDLDSLGRILNELLNNACKYTPANGAIRLTVTFEPAVVQLQVENTGIEIPASELPHVFDKFYRVPNNDPWKHGGTGLGLALTQRLTAHLGGSIQAKSEHNTTTFTVVLPQQFVAPLATTG